MDRDGTLRLALPPLASKVDTELRHQVLTD